MNVHGMRKFVSTATLMNNWSCHSRISKCTFCAKEVAQSKTPTCVPAARTNKQDIQDSQHNSTASQHGVKGLTNFPEGSTANDTINSSPVVPEISEADSEVMGTRSLLIRCLRGLINLRSRSPDFHKYHRGCTVALRLPLSAPLRFSIHAFGFGMGMAARFPRATLGTPGRASAACGRTQGAWRVKRATHVLLQHQNSEFPKEHWIIK